MTSRSHLEGGRVRVQDCEMANSTADASAADVLSTTAHDLTVVPLSAALGAEVRGISLTDAGPDEVEHIKTLLLDHMVLFFPDQHLTLDEHILFGSQFGPMESHPNLKNPFTDRAEIFEIAATPERVRQQFLDLDQIVEHYGDLEVGDRLDENTLRFLLKEQNHDRSTNQHVA